MGRYLWDMQEKEVYPDKANSLSTVELEPISRLTPKSIYRESGSRYPPAVVTYMSYSGLGIVRSLGRQGIPVYALDPNPKQIGMNSRYCQSKICPSVESNENEHIEYLISLSKTLGEKPVLFPTGDNTVLCYAKYENILEDFFLFTGPQHSTIEKLTTKDALYRTAVEFNVPVPVTYIPNSLSEVREIATKISYPCIIKPVRSDSWHRESIRKILGGWGKVIVISKSSELLSFYSRIAVYDPNVIISEVIPGDDSDLFYFVFYISKTHKVLGHFAGRKLRLNPIHFGSASFVESVYEEELERISIKFLKDIGYNGLGGMEFKLDSRDGKFKLIEFNTRFGLWDVLGTRCGVNLAYIAYCDTIGKRVSSNLSYRTGIKWLSTSLDFNAFLDYRKEGSISLLGWLRSTLGKKQWAVFAWDDIIPFLTSITGFLSAKVRRVFSKFCRSLGVKGSNG